MFFVNFYTKLVMHIYYNILSPTLKLKMHNYTTSFLCSSEQLLLSLSWQIYCRQTCCIRGKTLYLSSSTLSLYNKDGILPQAILTRGILFVNTFMNLEKCCATRPHTHPLGSYHLSSSSFFIPLQKYEVYEEKARVAKGLSVVEKGKLVQVYVYI